MHYDPYDIWSNKLLGQLKLRLYEGKLSSKIALIGVGVLEMCIPITLRHIIGVKQHQFSHVEAMLIRADITSSNVKTLHYLYKTRGDDSGWGLPFTWYSKNGIYRPNISYITNTPYVMEALLTLAEDPALRDEAMEMFHATLSFLRSLQVMHEDETGLALSYAPVEEPRIVVNANSYAAFAYAMHAVSGNVDIQTETLEKAEKLTNWVIRQQQENGSWFYYADEESGNFIDCFHSCFVVKNLLKVRRLVPKLADKIDPIADKGWRYIQDAFYDVDSGLCRRFSVRAQRDPFRWDLYDQAEYLGLLIDFGELEMATAFARGVEGRFSKRGNWYCRIDILGRRWGKNFLRWGIVPFWYHRARLEKVLAGVD